MRLHLVITAFLAIGTIALCTYSSIPAKPKTSAIRPAAVAGKFYPSNPSILKLAIQQFFLDAAPPIITKPIGLIVPHAGYIFAGQIYADAYRQAQGNPYDVIVILGTNHTAGDFNGVSLGGYSAFHTPLGDVPVEAQIVQDLLNESKDCNKNQSVHIYEHSIEVQLPFIQSLFPNARIVPAIIHPADYDLCIRFGQALAKVLKNRRALIVMSSDLSHYPNQKDAAKADQLTLETIASLDLHRIAAIMRDLHFPNLETRACGEAAILAGITAVKALGTKQVGIVAYANSGEIPAGDQDQTVGYGAVAFTTENISKAPSIFDRPEIPSAATPLKIGDKKLLLTFARKTIALHLTIQMAPMARGFPPRLSSPQGAFVTLKKAGELRGCIGRMQAVTPLGLTVGAMALEAAFKDPRFSPLQQSELKDLEIEISVLSPMQTIATPDAIVIGRDGVLMTKGNSSAVFLPQVAVENNWNKVEMLDNLCQKAGLQTGCWKQQAQFKVFQADVFSERDFR
jgi:MEMO1 family protein